MPTTLPRLLCPLLLCGLLLGGCGKDPMEVALPNTQGDVEALVELWNSDNAAAIVERANQIGAIHDPAGLQVQIRQLQNKYGAIVDTLALNINPRPTQADLMVVSSPVLEAEGGYIMLEIQYNRGMEIVGFSVQGEDFPDNRPPGS